MEDGAVTDNSVYIQTSDKPHRRSGPWHPLNPYQEVSTSCVQYKRHGAAVLSSRSKLKGGLNTFRKQPSEENTSSCTGGWASSSSTEDVRNDNRVPTSRTVHPLNGDFKYEAEPENLAENTVKPWATEKGFWRSSPTTQVSDAHAVLNRKGPGSALQKMGPSVDNEMQDSNTEVSSTQSEPAVPAGRELRRVESLESVCSSSSTLSLAERVEMNRSMLRQMLQKAQQISGDGHRAPVTTQTPEATHTKDGLNDSDWDSGIYCERRQRSFVPAAELPSSPRHEQAKRLLELARMKTRSNPVKADHTILPVQRDKPELLSRVGAPVQQASLVASDQVLGLGSLSDSSSSDSTGSSHRRRSHGQSPTRVRFQDESENDAEVRYIERQRRRAGQRVQGILVPKPRLSSYVNIQRPAADDAWKSKLQRRPENLFIKANGHYKADNTGQEFNSILSSDRGPFCCKGDSEGRMVPCWGAPTLPNRLVHMEHIKETYIYGFSPDNVESDMTHCSPANTVDNHRGALQKTITDTNGPIESGSPGTTRLFPNNTTALNSPASLKPHVLPSLASAKMSRLNHPLPQSHQPGKLALRLNQDTLSSQQVLKLMPSPQSYPVQNCGTRADSRCVPTDPSSEPSSEIKNCSRIIHQQPRGSQSDLEHDLIELAVPVSPARSPSLDQTTARVREPFCTEDDPELSENREPAPVFEQRKGRAQEALHRFFSAIGLNPGGRLGKSLSCSLEQLGPQSGPCARPTDNPQHTLKKAPSLQSLRLGSPFTQLKKSSSVQNLQCAKKKQERCNLYTPGAQACSPVLSRLLPRALSVEDVGNPSAVRSVGKITQVCPDGTILLELYRPPEGPFGFLISRGKGRTDSGVYVEDMGEGSTQKLYAGLLGVGDEILEVNGEKVAGLSLDLVTEMMTLTGTASVRVLRHRPPHR